MGRQQSTLYFSAELRTGHRGMVKGVQIFGIHIGGNPTNSQWHSGSAKHFHDLLIFEQIDPTVPVHIAIPTIWAGSFVPRFEYELISIDAMPNRESDFPDSLASRVGAVSLRDVVVIGSTPLSFVNVPSPPPVHRRRLEKQLGTSVLRILNIQLMVRGDAEVLH